MCGRLVKNCVFMRCQRLEDKCSIFENMIPRDRRTDGVRPTNKRTDGNLASAISLTRHLSLSIVLFVPQTDDFHDDLF